MHHILEKQLQHAFGEAFVPSKEWKIFLDSVSATYTHLDEDHARLNHSLEMGPKKPSDSDQCFCDTNGEVDKKIEEQRESFERYQMLVDNLSIGVYRNTSGPKGHFLEANSALVAMMEANTKEEFMKHNVSDFYENPKDRQRLVDKVIKYGFVKNEELHLVTLKGKRVIASVSTTMRKDKDGNVYFDGVLEDITARKATEDALRKAYEEMELNIHERTHELHERVTELSDVRKAMTNLLSDLMKEQESLITVKLQEEILIKELEKFKLAVDNVYDGIVITDPDAMVLYANESMERLTGFSIEEIVGKKSGALWKKPMPLEYYKKMWDTIKVQKKPFVGEIENRRKDDGVYTVTMSISPILNQKGDIEFFVEVQHDISKEKEIDKAKTEFVSLASHQLRTPLSTINWYAEMLLSGDVGVLSEDQKKYLEEVYRSNQRMVTLVNALLNVSRLELGTFMVEPEHVDIVELIQSVIGENTPQIQKRKLVVSTDFDKRTLVIHADPKLLRMVVQNIFSNAVKYTPVAGKIAVSLSLKDEFLLKISDTGYGIPKHQQEHIFQKLFRADNVREKDTEGTGLGLYIVKSILDYSGGKVWFESEENKGSTFYVSLPLEGMKKKEGTKTLAL